VPVGNRVPAGCIPFLRKQSCSSSHPPKVNRKQEEGTESGLTFFRKIKNNLVVVVFKLS